MTDYTCYGNRELIARIEELEHQLKVINSARKEAFKVFGDYSEARNALAMIDSAVTWKAVYKSKK